MKAREGILFCGSKFDDLKVIISGKHDFGTQNQLIVECVFASAKTKAQISVITFTTHIAHSLFFLTLRF